MLKEVLQYLLICVIVATIASLYRAKYDLTMYADRANPSIPSKKPVGGE